MGAANSSAPIQMMAMTIFDACFDDLALKGFNIALCRSMAMAVRVKIDTLTLKTCMKGQKGHIKRGRSQRCKTAA